MIFDRFRYTNCSQLTSQNLIIWPLKPPPQSTAFLGEKFFFHWKPECDMVPYSYSTGILLCTVRYCIFRFWILESTLYCNGIQLEKIPVIIPVFSDQMCQKLAWMRNNLASAWGGFIIYYFKSTYNRALNWSDKKAKKWLIRGLKTLKKV